MIAKGTSVGGISMLALYGITSFAKPDTIEKVISFSSENSQLFKTKNVTIKDHTGETGSLTFLFTPNVEITLAPFNSFHYLGDFEIGLSIDPNFTISDIENLLSENGFQYESGYLEGNVNNAYYLIPRKNGIFTPFFLISETDTSKNRFLPMIKNMHIQIDRKELSTTEDFIDTVGLRKTIHIHCSPGDKNQIVSILSEIVESHVSETRVRLDNIELLFYQNIWEIRQDEPSS